MGISEAFDIVCLLNGLQVFKIDLSSPIKWVESRVGCAFTYSCVVAQISGVNATKLVV